MVKNMKSDYHLKTYIPLFLNVTLSMHIEIWMKVFRDNVILTVLKYVC